MLLNELNFVFIIVNTNSKQTFEFLRRRGTGAFETKGNYENDDIGNENKGDKVKEEKKYRLRETEKRLSRVAKISDGEFFLIYSNILALGIISFVHAYS